MKKLLLLVILAAFGLLAYNFYSWKDKPEHQDETKIKTFAVDNKPNIIRTHRIGLNWEDKSYEGIKPLHPGYLRSNINPDNAPEFIAFAKTLNTTPWMVISPDLSNEDYYSLGHYLKDEKFNHMIVEIENSSPDHVENAFRYLIDGSGKEINIKKIVNTPGLQVDQLLATLENIPSTDYLLVQMNDNVKQMADKIRNLGKKIAIYDEQATGALLGKRWIEQLSMKIQPQVISIKESNDANALALKMMNRAILGSAHRIHPKYDNPQIIGIAFKSTSKWTAAFFNDSDSSESIEVEFPKDNRLLPHTLLTLTQNSEDKIKRGFTDCCKDRLVKFTIPAHSLVVLPPQNNLTEAGITTQDG